MIKWVTYGLFLLLPMGVVGQNFGQKGDRHFSDGAVSRALVAYEKAFQKDSAAQWLGRISECSMRLSNHAAVVDQIDLLQQLTTLSAAEVTRKTRALLALDQMKKAQQWHLGFDEFYGDSVYDQTLATLTQIMRMKEVKNKAFSVRPMAPYNSKSDEFGLTPMAGGFYYVSNRLVNHVTGDRDEKNAPYFNVVRLDSAGLQLLDKAFHTPYHDGPLSILGDSLAVITAVEGRRKGKQANNRLYLRYFTKQNGKWSEDKSRQFKLDSVDLAHAVLTGPNTIVLSANWSTGYGGMDLYRATYSNGTWQATNLGPNINSAANERFPQLWPGGGVVFASDRNQGFGGLDLYLSKQDQEQYKPAKNLGPIINAGRDDFSMIFTDQTSGYFASNRYGGRGGDDIYSFVMHRNPLGVTDMRGQFFLQKLKPGPGVELILLDENNQEIARTVTDAFGGFGFDNLDPNGHYLVQLATEDAVLADDARMFLMTAEGLKVVKLERAGLRSFIFNALPKDKINTLPGLGAQDYEVKLVNIHGRVFERLPGDIPPGLQVAIVDDQGQMIFITDLEADGTFNFDQLPSDKTYRFKLIGAADDVQFEVLDEYGDVIRKVSINPLGLYDYTYLDPDVLALELQNTGDQAALLHISINGELFQKLPGDLPPGLEVLLVDDQGNVIATTITDKFGRFTFNNLPPDANYTFKVMDAKEVQMNILDDSNQVTAVIARNQMGLFGYQRLARDGVDLIQMLDENDVTMVVVPDELFVNYSIFYARNEWEVNRESAHQLDKLVLLLLKNPHVTVTLSAHTDATSSDDYNLELSQKRADAAVTYIVNKGISESRVTGIGYGEQQLVNHCKNGVQCSEQEHKQNRRTEIRIARRR